MESSTTGVEGIYAVGDDFYVTTRGVCSPPFAAEIEITANSPWHLKEPTSRRLRLAIGESGEYRVDDGSGVEEGPKGDIYVLKLDIEQSETNVCWKSTSCVLNLTDDSYTGGGVEWTSNPSGISGRGRSITFNPSLLAPGEYVVTARTDVVKAYFDTCVVRVVKIVTETVSSFPSDRSRRTVGVGERVMCRIVPASLSANWHGTSGLLTPTFGNFTLWEAPHNSKLVKVVADVIDGPQCDIDFNVIVPSGFLAPHAPSTIPLGQNIAGAGMRVNLWLSPLNVSFSRVEIVEIGAVSTNATGYFADTNLWPTANLNHAGHGADTWVPVGNANFIGTDNACSGACPGPWSQGHFTWPIPAAWRVAGDSSTNSLSWSDQDFSIDQLGNVTVLKFNHGVTRSTNDVYTIVY